MEKRIRKDKSLIIIVILLTLILLSWIISFVLGIQTKRNNKSKSALEKKYNVVSKELSNKEDELKELEEKLASYDNIDGNIESTKREYFNNIKMLEDDIISGKTNRKIAYITFDDGPYYNTYKVLDILDEYGVKATFFTISMNGQYCYDNKEADCFQLYKEYVSRGHTIANHTYTHAIFRGLYNSVDSFMDAIVKQEEHVKNQTGGYVTNITRFPGGSSTAKWLKDPIIEQLRARGYGWVDWSANDGDGGNLSSTDQAWNNFTSTINDNIEVILFHDYNYYTTAILPDAITYLQNNGYEIYPLFYESNKINK